MIDLKAHFNWNNKLMMCICLMISSCNIRRRICQIVMNNAGDSLSKPFLWNRVPWDFMEFLADTLSQSVYAGIDVISQS